MEQLLLIWLQEGKVSELCVEGESQTTSQLREPLEGQEEEQEEEEHKQSVELQDITTKFVVLGFAFGSKIQKDSF